MEYDSEESGTNANMGDRVLDSLPSDLWEFLRSQETLPGEKRSIEIGYLKSRLPALKRWIVRAN